MQDAGIDVGDPQIRNGRSWRWGAVRILGLLNKPPIGLLEEQVDEKHIRRHPLYATRIQTELLGSRAQ